VLLEIADCHFHFNIVFASSVFMYLYKYLHKGKHTTSISDNKIQHSQQYCQGPNITHYQITENKEQPDEIEDYVQGQYLSVPEATWRILGYDIICKEPAVTCLPVHYPGEHQALRNTGQ